MDNNISKSQINLSPQEKRELLAKLLQEKASQQKYSHPLSCGQQSLWFLHQNTPESAAYNVAFTARICSQVDATTLRHVFQTLINRHPSLRSTFSLQEGQPIQTVHGYQEVYFKEIDAATDTDDEFKRRVVETYQLPFDFGQGPLLRVNLLTRSVTDHVLLLTVHHIVNDGWSLWLQLNELSLLYPAQKAGQVATLPPLKMPYKDFVQWQAELLAGPEGEKLWEYWQKQLSGDLPVLNLPTDRPYPPVQSHQGASVTFRLPIELTQQLKGLAQTSKATLYMIILAAFQVLLHRYTSQEDILVGSPVTGRSQSEFAGIVGHFINMLVLRAKFDNNLTFTAFLEQVRQTVLGALAHQDYPFPVLVKHLQPNRDPSRSPIFQVVFALQKPQQYGKQSGELADLLGTNDPNFRVNLGELLLAPFEMVQQEGQFDLSLEMMEVKTSLVGVFKYNTDLFDATTITRMVGHFKTLLEGIVVNPKQHVFKLPLLTEEERQQLLVEWNDTATDYPQDKCIHQLFEAQVEKKPDAVAVVFEDQQLSYQELNTRANQLAHHLQTLGVKPEVLVGICVERSLEMIIGLLGILKAGGAYVPLDPKYPQARLAFMLEDAQVQTLVTQQPLLATFTKHKLPSIVCLDTDWQAAIFMESEENPKGLATPENIAYVIYTSGSTGKPKGVMVAHQGLCNLAMAQFFCFGVQPKDRILQFSSLSFDASIWEIVMAWASGAALYLGTREALLAGSPLFQLLNDKAITTVTLPPSVLASLPMDTLPSLQTIIVAGEVCPAEFVDYWIHECQFFNAYGPTETTVCATVFKCTDDNKNPPIGSPIANTQVYVLDATNLQQVPIGIPGELYIGGVGLARGYLNRPVLTAEKFIPNPFSNDPVARLYKTGDLVRYLSDGNIEYLGRIDHQVKIRGFRIELEEIEAVLNQDSTVREAIVIAREDEPGNKRLVAYIVSKLILERLPIQSVCVAEFGDEPPITLNTEDISYNGVGLVGVPPTCQADQNVRLRLQLPDEMEELCLKGRVAWCQEQRAGIQFTLTSAEQTQLDKRIENLFETQGFMKVIQRTSTAHLRDVLKEKLPDYMVPASFVFLSAIPLTPNGKIDRKALPNPQTLRLEDEASYIAPETEIEHKIATVWQSVLQINKVGIHDNFFDLGGNSLLIIQVQNKLVEVLNKEVPVVAFFQYPTIYALAHYLADSHHKPTTFQATYDHAHKAKEARHRHHKHHKK